MMDKLSGFPKVYYINLDEEVERNASVLSQFKHYGITNYERISAIRPTTSEVEGLRPAEYGCNLSHTQALSKIANSDDPYGLVFEDDIDLSTIKDWTFTWSELLSFLPTFDVVQLYRETFWDQREGLKLNPWKRLYKSSVAYLITNSYAKTLTASSWETVADMHMYEQGDSLSIPVFSSFYLPSAIQVNDGWSENERDYIKAEWAKKPALKDLIL